MGCDWGELSSGDKWMQASKRWDNVGSRRACAEQDREPGTVATGLVLGEKSNAPPLSRLEDSDAPSMGIENRTLTTRKRSESLLDRMSCVPASAGRLRPDAHSKLTRLAQCRAV